MFFCCSTTRQEEEDKEEEAEVSDDKNASSSGDDRRTFINLKNWSSSIGRYYIFDGRRGRYEKASSNLEGRTAGFFAPPT